MDIVSPPAVIEETVTDIDIGFSGSIRSLTLRAADSYALTGDTLEVTIQDPFEIITFFRPQMQWYSRRQRVMRRPVKTAVIRSTPVPATVCPPA